MAFNVRVFGHVGLAQIPIYRPRQFSSDSVFQISQPYEFAELISVSAVAASSAPVADVNSGRPVTLLWIEIPNGQAIRYEVNPPGRAAVAGEASPRMEGRDYIEFRSGWTISMIDAAGLP